MQEIIEQFQQTSLIEWGGTITGLIAVVLSIREKVLAWPLFIVCYALYALLSYQASLPAAMLLNLLFIPISVYGWIQWSQSSANAKTDQTINEGTIRSCTLMEMLILGIVTLVLAITLGAINQMWVKGTLPYLDAFATVVSFAAQWMLSRKMAENWIAWIIADLAFAILWGIQGYWIAVIMFSVFIVLATSGWISWKKESRNNV